MTRVNNSRDAATAFRLLAEATGAAPRRAPDMGPTPNVAAVAAGFRAAGREARLAAPAPGKSCCRATAAAIARS